MATIVRLDDVYLLKRIAALQHSFVLQSLLGSICLPLAVDLIDQWTRCPINMQLYQMEIYTTVLFLIQPLHVQLEAKGMQVLWEKVFEISINIYVLYLFSINLAGNVIFMIFISLSQWIKTKWIANEQHQNIKKGNPFQCCVSSAFIIYLRQ